MRLLLLSNSTIKGQPYLSWPQAHINDFLGSDVGEILFVPYAAVTFSFDEYEKMVNDALSEYTVTSIHHADDPAEAVNKAEAIAVGGGNTFQLLEHLQRMDLVQPIRDKVTQGTPYMGWSAGSNMACPTIKTTNDMPIVEPPSFNALNLVDFQMNPHYTEAVIEGHGGESRDQRLLEFCAANQDMAVYGVQDGSGLRVEDGGISLIGDKELYAFKYGMEKQVLTEWPT